MSLEEQEYILGTDSEELVRLRFQHQAWVKEGYALWETAGIRAGQTVVDLGCGPGFTSFELAHLVGPAGKVISRDQSSRFLSFLGEESRRRGHGQIQPSLGPVEDLQLPANAVDAAYARWLFCWLPDPGSCLAEVVRVLKPGGVLVVQDYLDWGGMKLVPPSAAFDTAVLACMESWRQGGSTINIGEILPTLASETGLTLTHFRPRARLGSGYCYTPVMFDAVFQKPTISVA